MADINELAKNSLKDGVNDKVKEAFNRYHKVAQETFQKVLADTEVKHQEVINILNSRFVAAEAERDGYMNKLSTLEQVLENKIKELEFKTIEIDARDRAIETKKREIKLRDQELDAKNREIKLRD
ncbi:MAG: hypothetical protein HQK68_13260, partial [Desulfamplus sp.]|nr:hypothetical protein [Desulfamplus sp.]